MNVIHNLLLVPVCVVKGCLVEDQTKEVGTGTGLVRHRRATGTIQVRHFYQFGVPIRPIYLVSYK